MPLARAPQPQPVSPQVIHSQKDMLAAFNLAANVSGLDEKEIYLALEIDPGHWSRIRKGEAHFPLNKLLPFCDIVGNEILLEYWARCRGKGLHLLETEAERLLRVERDKSERLQLQVDVLKDALKR